MARTVILTNDQELLPRVIVLETEMRMLKEFVNKFEAFQLRLNDQIEDIRRINHDTQTQIVEIKAVAKASKPNYIDIRTVFYGLVAIIIAILGWYLINAVTLK